MPRQPVTIGFDRQGSAAVMAGTYTDWDCPNELYGVSSLEPFLRFVEFFVLHYTHRLNIPLLGTEYAALPHVMSVGPSAFAGDGNDVCASFDGDTFSYVFDAADGDCPAGCIEHTYSGFSTSASGEITSLGTWTKGDGDPPSWCTSGAPGAIAWSMDRTAGSFPQVTWISDSASSAVRTSSATTAATRSPANRTTGLNIL